MVGDIIVDYMLVLVRVSACLMLLPGFSSVQIPMNVRLFIAFGISFTISSMVSISNSYDLNGGIANLLSLIAGEFLIAAFLAIPIRFMFLAMSFLGEIITQMIGLNPIPGAPIADDQSSTILSGLFNITSIVLFFSTGLQFTFIIALAMSFEMYPPGSIMSIEHVGQTITEDLDRFFNIALRLGAPILIYATIANLIAGLVNKLTPQIPVYFVSTPFLICGGLVLLVWIADDILINFHVAVVRYLNFAF